MSLEENLERRNAMLAEVIWQLDEYLSELGTCDHAVNVCHCDLRKTLDQFGTYCHHLTGGMVGWRDLRFDVHEADSNNSSFRKGTIND